VRNLFLILAFVPFLNANESEWIKQLIDEDETVRKAASSKLVASESPKLERTLLLKLARAEDPAKIELLKVLTERRSTLVLNAASDLAIRNKNEAVRIQALSTLSALGSVQELPLLLDVAVTSRQPLRGKARQAMIDLKGEEVNEMIGFGLESAPDDAMRFELAAVAKARGAKEAVPGLLRVANSAGTVGPETRLECLRALEDLATLDDLTPLMVIYASEADLKARAAAGQVVRTVVLGEPEKGEAAVLNAHELSDGRARAGIVRLLAELGGEKPLAVVRADRTHKDAMVKAAAWRSLVDWPNAGPAADVLALAKAAEDETVNEAAFAGYLRMIGLAAEKDRPAMFEQAKQAARSDAQKDAVAALETPQNAEDEAAKTDEPEE